MLERPSIAQMKAESADSLWHFLASLPGTHEAQVFYALMLAGTLGMIANYMVRWARQEIGGSLLAYLFLSNVRGTALSFFGFVGLAVTSIAAGIFTTDTNAFVGWATVLWFGATNGFAVDAIANKGTRPEWTDEERKARATPPKENP